jgi:hypothetical protein
MQMHVFTISAILRPNRETNVIFLPILAGIRNVVCCKFVGPRSEHWGGAMIAENRQCSVRRLKLFDINCGTDPIFYVRQFSPHFSCIIFDVGHFFC